MGLEVIDWQNLDQVLAEHEFSFSGYVDQKSATEMGKILGPSTSACCQSDQMRDRLAAVRIFGDT